MSDISHPCQAISDLYTLKEKFGTLKLNVLWMGDMNNVCYSLIEAVNTIEELSLPICTPLSISKSKDWKFNSRISIVESLENTLLESVNCVMTDVFLSMNDEENDEKVSILKNAKTSFFTKNSLFYYVGKKSYINFYPQRKIFI